MDTLAPALARRPALPGMLARKVLSAAWIDAPPPMWSRRWLVEACTAELAWARADYDRLAREGIVPAARFAHHGGYDGAHPGEAYRLPHERAAARTLNALTHLQGTEARFRDLAQRLPPQRRAATDPSQRESFRASWAGVLMATIAELAVLKADLRGHLSAFRRAARDYRELREAIDAPTGAPCLKEAA